MTAAVLRSADGPCALESVEPSEHEGAGVVEAVGSDVTTIAVGLIEEFPLDQIDEAEQASLSGRVVKPDLRPG